MPPELEQQRDTLTRAGLALVLVQTAERMLRHTLLLVIQDGDALDLKRFQEGSVSLDRKTLGQLMATLRARADLDDGFDDALREFLRDRNALAHDLERVEGFDLRSAKGRAVANAFLANLIENTETIIKILASLNLDWQKQTDIRTPVDDQIRRYIGEEYVGIADSIFFAKSK